MKCHILTGFALSRYIRPKLLLITDNDTMLSRILVLNLSSLPHNTQTHTHIHSHTRSHFLCIYFGAESVSVSLSLVFNVCAEVFAQFYDKISKSDSRTLAFIPWHGMAWPKLLKRFNKLNEGIKSNEVCLTTNFARRKFVQGIRIIGN